jgi:PAS domain S-box-containing protein
VLCVAGEAAAASRLAAPLARGRDRITTATAVGVEAALDRLDDADCVVSGHDPPGLDGVALVEAVRSVRPCLPVVLATADGSETLASEAVAAGVTDYLPVAGADHGRALASRVEAAVDRAADEAGVAPAVREANRALVDARTRAAVDRRACAALAEDGPYRLAWVGDVDADASRVRPRAAAGAASDYLDEVTVTTDESPLGGGPGGTAAREGRLVVSQEIAADERFAPWAATAADHGLRSVAAVPLSVAGERYGLLLVYADRPDAFDGRTRSLLSGLGDTVAHAHRRIAVQQAYDSAYERQYRDLFEDAPVLFVATRAVDGAPTIDYANRLFAETLGHDRETLRGRPLADLYDEASAAALLDDGGYDRALSGEFVREGRTLVGADGSTVDTLLRAAPRRAPDGDIVGTLAMYVDVTNETHLRALERQNERLDRFSSVVSHDLRNPLHVAKGRLSLARADADGRGSAGGRGARRSDEADGHLAAVDRALDRMDALIDDLLTLARDGDRVTEPTAVDLAALVDDCWAVDVPDADGATLAVETGGAVRADRSRLRQLVGNLLSNAVEHGSTDDGVTVTVGDLPDGGFYVADDGPGVPPAERDAAFERGHSTAADGTGFGLAIVREIADAHGWRVELGESAAGGACVAVRGVERPDD